VYEKPHIGTHQKEDPRTGNTATPVSKEQVPAKYVRKSVEGLKEEERRSAGEKESPRFCGGTCPWK
jgi:hypothetical protein